MRNLILFSVLATMFLWSCSDENLENIPDPTQTEHELQEIKGQNVISQITIGEGTVVFLSNGEDIALFEKNLPGKEAILGEELVGLTLKEIHQELAPGKAVPTELLNVEERFEIRSSDTDLTNEFPAEGANLGADKSSSNSRTQDLNDVWFRDNYCNPSSFYNGYKACLLNRKNMTTDWAWSNCTRSRVYVYPYQGGQIHLKGQINGSTIFDADLLVGWVYNYYMYSGKSFWGCRQNKKHYYSITNTSGDGWHWSLRSNLDC